MRQEEPTTFHPRHGDRGINLYKTGYPRPPDGVGIIFWGPLWGAVVIAIVVMAVHYLWGFL